VLAKGNLAAGPAASPARRIREPVAAK